MTIRTFVRWRGARKRIAAVVTAAAAALALAGCASDKVEAIYSISAATQVPAGGATGAQVLIPEPAALQSLNTANIAVKPTENTYSYYQSVALEDTAPKVFQRVILATLAAEDASFYEHDGVDRFAILRAFQQNIRAGRLVSGASTITQ